MKRSFLSIIVFLYFFPAQAQQPVIVSPQWLHENRKDPNLVILYTGVVIKGDFDREHIEGSRFLWADWLAPDTPEASMNGHAAGCRYCQAHTIRAAERYGADAEKLENIWEFKTNPAFTEPERAALDFALASSIIPNAVDDSIAENLRLYWDDGEIVEMLGVIALFGFLNRWNYSMGTQIEDGAVESGEKFLSARGWTTGKHRY